jgi:hypothetical protein
MAMQSPPCTSCAAIEFQNFVAAGPSVILDTKPRDSDFVIRIYVFADGS